MRTMARKPAFTAVAILSIALGIGANTAIFSLVRAVLLKPLPFENPDRLVLVWEDESWIGFPKNTPAPGTTIRPSFSCASQGVAERMSKSPNKQVR